MNTTGNQEVVDNGANVAMLHNVKRSPHWPAVMKEKLRLQPCCEICGATEGLNVHHVVNFELCVSFGFPEDETNLENTVVLCETRKGEKENNCHLDYGHGGSFFNFNPNIREDIKKYKGTPYSRLQESNQDAVAEIKKGVLPSLDKMTVEQKEYVKKIIVDWYHTPKS